MEVASQEHPFTAMLISRSRGTCLIAYQVLAVDDLVADEAEDGEAGAVGGDVVELRGRHGAEGELQRGEGAVLRDQLPEAAAHVLHLQLEVADARDAAQAHAAVVGDVKPTEIEELME